MDYFSRRRANSAAAPPRRSSRPSSSESNNTHTHAQPATQPSSRPSSSQAIRIRRLGSQTPIALARESGLSGASPRIPLPSALQDAARQQQQHASRDENASRRRSSSEPQRPSNSLVADIYRQPTHGGYLAPLNEEASGHSPGISPAADANSSSRPAPPSARPSAGHLRRASSAVSAAWTGMLGHGHGAGGEQPADIPNEPNVNNYEREVVDLLDVIDPEVSALTTLNNLQNSLFIPNLGRFLNRTPTYDLTWSGEDGGHPSPISEFSSDPDDTRPNDEQHRDVSRLPDNSVESVETPQDLSSGVRTPSETPDPSSEKPKRRLKRSHTITSHLSGKSDEEQEAYNYAVLPHGVKLHGWSEQDKDELNDHVRHLLHSKREGFKRSMRAFGKYVRTPLGAFVTIYAFLVTFWGAAWVFFLIGWISAGGRQAYFIEICDQILTALFAVVGDGLAPFRAVDTYHMIFIAKYHYMTWKLRKERGLPELEDPNDLPEYANYLPSMPKPPKSKLQPLRPLVTSLNSRKNKEAASPTTAESTPTTARLPTAETADSRFSKDVDIQDVDIEDAAPGLKEGWQEPEAVLTAKQYQSFKHHQAKFQNSHTFYRPHETVTHHAFPIKLLITTVVLLDFHSIFQICLGGTTWGIPYQRRPKAVTAVILTCSILCNIAGGVTISIGDKRTRKNDVVEIMYRQALTEHAMRKMHRQKGLKVPKRLQSGKDAKKEQKLYDSNVRREMAKEIPKQSIDVRRSMDARRSLDVRRSLDTSRALGDGRSNSTGLIKTKMPEAEESALEGSSSAPALVPMESAASTTASTTASASAEASASPSRSGSATDGPLDPRPRSGTTQNYATTGLKTATELAREAVLRAAQLKG